jgi:hypothetical protein
MKIGDKVKWSVAQGKAAGMGREGEVVAKVKAGEDARVVLEKKTEAKRAAIRINATQATSGHDRVLVKIDATPEPFYLCPRADRVTVVEESPKA